MKYTNIIEARFLSRPNRFIAYVDIAGKTEKVHVKNTGRCRELLTDQAIVYLEKSNKAERTTAYDLVAVRKGERIVNMDSSAPNKAVHEWLQSGGLFDGAVKIYPEKKYGNSRFDFYIETMGEKIFLEVKGVTLEQENAVYFPDAPSERAVKHVNELIEAVGAGYGAYVVLVIQMKDVDFFAPNKKMHPEFAEALLRARQRGVKILAYDCKVSPDSMEIADEVPVILSKLDLIAEPLLDWYDSGKRILPWREDPTPYNVWLSEIMLQQTRVEAVRPYFERFKAAVPDIKSLAGMEEEQLIKLWEGLGYYNRARNLQKAAKEIIEKHNGKMPAEYGKLITLPGIGSYTAGAIASIAYGIPVPAVDGNVLRVLSRLRMDGEDILSRKIKDRVETELQAVIPPDRAGDFNQALMELGAMVCVPNGEPKCRLCPWESFCEARIQDRTGDFPKKKSKKPRGIEEKTVLVIKDENRFAFEKRPKTGLLAGMYGFPMLEGFRSPKEVINYLKGRGIGVLRIQELNESRHVFSHKEWHMKGYAITVDELDKIEERDWIFVDKHQARKEYPIPAAYSAYAGYAGIKLGI